MNLSGILVVSKPDRTSEVLAGLAVMQGLEVHQCDPETGRIIVVQEAADIHAELEAIKRIKVLPHVIMAEMVYHYIAEDEKEYEALPPELDAGGEACSIPKDLLD